MNLIPNLYEPIFSELYMELDRAEKRFPEPLHSVHEGYAIILEEVEELWGEIKKYPSHSSLDRMRTEAIQSAAMLLRFIKDLT